MRDTSPAGTATTAGAYRPDIDGMRALAVGLVVLHHVGFHRVSGGYIGVDVFFVISGYLITSIIFPKIAERRFSYLDFFGRRVKRLSPVLSLVIAVTLAAGLVLLLPSDLEKLASSAVWVSLFAGNFFFWRNYGGYFADDAQSAPLLHTWSLAVEEQYYLLWPLSLVIALRLFGARNTVILICLAVPPLIYLSELGTRLTIGAAYYLLPTRFFELLVGSVAALLHLPERLALHRHVATLLGSAGLAAIVYAGITLTPASAFPGYNALWPVLGTLLVIVSTPGLANRALTAAPIVYLGKLSYSLYLWHWPIIACMHYTGLEFSLTARLLAMGGALLLSMASYHLVENPLRHRRYASRRQIFLWLYLAPTALIAAAALAILATQGLPQRFDAALVNADRAVATRVHQQRSACHVSARSWQQPLDAECVFGAGGAAAPTVLLIGDSHANHLVPFFEALLRDAGLQGSDYTMDRCPGLFGLEYGANAPIARQCAGRNALASMAVGERGTATWCSPPPGPTRTRHRYMWTAGASLTTTQSKRRSARPCAARWRASPRAAPCPCWCAKPPRCRASRRVARCRCSCSAPTRTATPGTIATAGWTARCPRCRRNFRPCRCSTRPPCSATIAAAARCASRICPCTAMTIISTPRAVRCSATSTSASTAIRSSPATLRRVHNHD
jgi:peptidoglycan/LPS O-acetylase OafA/YrhL